METESRLPVKNIKLTSEIETRLKNGTYATNPKLYKDDSGKLNTRLAHFKEAYKKSQRKNTATKISELEQVLQKLQALSPVFAAPVAAPAAAPAPAAKAALALAKAPAAAPAAPAAKAPAAVPAAAAIPAAKAAPAPAAAPVPAAKAPAALPLKPVSERTQTPYPKSPSKTIEALRTAKAEAEAEEEEEEAEAEAEEEAKEEEEDVIVVNNSQEAYVEINHKCPADSNESFKLGGDELADGNCFYSSLYRSALHHSQSGLVSKIFNIFGGVGQPTDEKAFITQLRTRVGDLLIQGIDSEKKQKYLKNIDKRPDILTNAGKEEQREQTRTFFETLLKSAFEGHGAQLQVWVEEAPDQIKAFFNIKKSINTQQLITDFLSKYNNESSSERFYTDMATFIKKDRVYSSQIDIEVIKYVLEKNKILLEIVSDKTSKKCMFLSGMPALWLYRRIGSAHYGYFRKSLEAKAPAAKAAAAKAAGAKAAEKPCQKLYDPCTKKEITGPNEHQKLLARVLELNDAKTSGTASGTRKRKLRKSRKTRKH